MATTMYQIAKNVINKLNNIGDNTTIPIPGNLPSFRKFLCEISKTEHKKFTTKVINNRLHIMRVEYYSIHDKLNN